MSVFDRWLTTEYNCAHYAAELWEAETGLDIRPLLRGFLLPPEDRGADPSLRRSFSGLPQPSSPCLVLFRRVRAAPHVGVFLRGRVQHLTDRGVVRQLIDTASIGYSTVRYYAPRHAH